MPRLPDYPSLRIGILLLLLLCNYAAAQSALFWIDRNLVATHRGGDAHHALQTLFAGPTPRQVARGWSTSIPPATRLLAVRTRGDELVIVLSEPFLQTLGQGQLEPALEQIIKTGLRSACTRLASAHAAKVPPSRACFRAGVSGLMLVFFFKAVFRIL